VRLLSWPNWLQKMQFYLQQILLEKFGRAPVVVAAVDAELQDHRRRQDLVFRKYTDIRQATLTFYICFHHNLVFPWDHCIHSLGSLAIIPSPVFTSRAGVVRFSSAIFFATLNWVGCCGCLWVPSLCLGEWCNSWCLQPQTCNPVMWSLLVKIGEPQNLAP